DEPFTGFQNATAYRLKVDPHEDGEPVSRIRPRALLAPPGWPDFMTRERFVRAGAVPLSGRAWSGRAPVTGGRVSPDGGAGRAAAGLAPPARTPRPPSPGGPGPTRGRRHRGGTSCSSAPPTSRGPNRSSRSGTAR